MTSISEIPGIDKVAVERLRSVGVMTTMQLLEDGATSTGRMKLADEANLDDKAVKGWVHAADLLRIKGIGPEFVSLLRAAGVNTVPRLAYRSSESLYAELVELNDAELLVGRLPSHDELREFVTEAKRLPKIVRH